MQCPMLLLLAATIDLRTPPGLGRSHVVGWRRPHPRRAAVIALDSPVDLLTSALDGDVPAILEVTVISAFGAGAVLAARGMLRDEEPLVVLVPPVRAPIVDKVCVEVDLGDDGEPKGLTRLFFRRLLPRSELLQLQLRVPLGLLIEENEETGHIVVTGALPGYGALGQVEVGDVIRALSCYAEVVSGAPMWQQVTSGTPMGTRALKRLAFTTEGATFSDVRAAIASCAVHSEAGGGGRLGGHYSQCRQARGAWRELAAQRELEQQRCPSTPSHPQFYTPCLVPHTPTPVLLAQAPDRRRGRRKSESRH